MPITLQAAELHLAGEAGQRPIALIITAGGLVTIRGSGLYVLVYGRTTRAGLVAAAGRLRRSVGSGRRRRPTAHNRTDSVP